MAPEFDAAMLPRLSAAKSASDTSVVYAAAIDTLRFIIEPRPPPRHARRFAQMLPPFAWFSRRFHCLRHRRLSMKARASRKTRREVS